MRRILLAAIAAACLAIPALAAADDDGVGTVDAVTCTDGTMLDAPFDAPVCGGHGDIASATCEGGEVLTAPLDGKRCPAVEEELSADEPTADDEWVVDDESIPSDERASDDQASIDDQATSDDQSSERGDDDPVDEPKRPRKTTKPRFKAAFLSHVWRIGGEANGYAAGVLDFTALDFIRLPRKWAGQDDAFVGEDARVLVGSKTRVYDADHHRVTGGVTTTLDGALDVTVSAKILPFAKWQKDKDGTPVPTLRAKRIVIEG